MKKITILALHLGYGGITSAIAMLANSLSDTYDITIVSTYKLYEKPRFDLDERIKIEYLIEDDLALRVAQYKEQILKLRFLKLINLLWINYLKKGQFINLIKDAFNSIPITRQKKTKMIDYIKKCDSDIVISTMDLHNLWLGKYGKKDALKIGWEHNHHNNNKRYIKKVTGSVQKLDYLVLVSKELTEFYAEKLKNTNCKCMYIPNTIDYIPTKKSPLKNKNIVTIGRLVKEKGYVDLIDVYSIVYKTFPDWTLNIIGDGSEKNAIENKIKKYGLEKNVILHGYQKHDYINEVLKKSSLYVMSSHTESFGIVLLEAYAFGIPAVAFTSAQGACEIISDNWDGYLIKNRDKEQMAKRICDLISNYNRRFVMGKNAAKKAEEYSVEKIKNKWIEMMEK